MINSQLLSRNLFKNLESKEDSLSRKLKVRLKTWKSGWFQAEFRSIRVISGINQPCLKWKSQSAQIFRKWWKKTDKMLNKLSFLNQQRYLWLIWASGEVIWVRIIAEKWALFFDFISKQDISHSKLALYVWKQINTSTSKFARNTSSNFRREEREEKKKRGKSIHKPTNLRPRFTEKSFVVEHTHEFAQISEVDV